MTTTNYKGFSIENLKSTFDAVRNPSDWKAPILCHVSGACVAIVCAAIEFYTATTPKVSMSQTPLYGIQYVIESEGYRMGPAGDH